MNRLVVILLSSIICYFLYFPFFKNFQTSKPAIEKLGYIPDNSLFRASLGEFKWFVGYYITFNALTYYGGKVLALERGNKEDIEYQSLLKTLKSSAMINPYYEDTYHLIQAVFPWEKGMTKETNEVLEYVKKYRYWDYRIPLYLGFNYGFFLKDYERAAQYFQEAAKKSGNYIFASISAKYLVEAGEEDFALSFLEEMFNEAKDEGLKTHYLLRIETIKIIKKLNEAVNIYKERFGKNPKDIKDLVDGEVISKIPAHPRGGKFYIDKDGKVKSSN